MKTIHSIQKQRKNDNRERNKFEVVKLVKGKPTKFTCKMCPNPYTRGFRDCEKHLEGKHFLPPDVVRDWHCFKIGKAISNGNLARQEALYKILEQGLPPTEEEGEEEEEEGGKEGEGSAQPSSLPPPTPIAQDHPFANSSSSFEKKMLAFMETVAQKIGTPGKHEARSIEVDLPTVTIKASPILPDGTTLKTWQHPEGEKATRVACPLNSGKLAKDYTFDLSEFQKWLPRHTKVKADQSVFDTCGNLERLCQMSASKLPANCKPSSQPASQSIAQPASQPATVTPKILS